ncbi:YciI family protein [bacterium]|nr:MAG: YciI family protein [bacterium]
MNYMLLIYEDESVTDGAREGEAFDHCVRDCDGLVERLIASGQHVDAGILLPSETATSIRVREGQRLVTDGPYAETREQLAGYLVIEADNLDQAMDIAVQHPIARIGTVEIRPLMDIVFPQETLSEENRFRPSGRNPEKVSSSVD